ncbi:hypothetical protein REPUB_Repub05bG0150600 [Reevesia pubescens]
MPSKFLLYQQSVQSPKGDISYLQKFFLMYVGGRLPLHLQEDFCGTALFRISLFHGNVLKSHEAKLVSFMPQELIRNIQLEESDNNSKIAAIDPNMHEGSTSLSNEESIKAESKIPAQDIVCAFNYSCCCLHKHTELVLYFKHVLEALSRKGGIFVMNLYGGMSSEQSLRLQKRFPNFRYTWEQAEFDIIERKTRISLQFHLQKKQKRLRHAFSYSWRLWSLPEINDCLEEAGFRSVLFWLRKMTDTSENKSTRGIWQWARCEV